MTVTAALGDPGDFYDGLDRIRSLAAEGRGPEAAALAGAIGAGLATLDGGVADMRRGMLAGLLAAHGITPADAAPDSPHAEAAPLSDAPPLSDAAPLSDAPPAPAPAPAVPAPAPAPVAAPPGPPVPLRLPDAALPGVALVTCCMNRNENLIRALPSWLAIPELSEIIIVDWSSTRPVADELAAAGLDDPRIRVARVEGEPRWVLSYAFNLGFRLVRHAAVLKTDADIVLERDFFTQNRLEQGHFIAGNWRRARAGQAFVNGFFYVGRDDLMRINGFNEYITTYGWDDDDIYDRLENAGITRVDVAEGTVTHLDHDDEARQGTTAPSQSGWEDLAALTMFKIRTNRFIATIMPGWDGNRIMMPYAMTGDAARPVLQRAGASIHLVPAHLRALAERLAAREMVSWRAGLRAFDLTDDQIDLLLRCRRLDAIRPLHVELLLAGAGVVALASPRHLVADLDGALLALPPARLAPVIDRLVAAARASGRALVLRSAHAARPATLPATLPAAIAHLPVWYGIGPVTEITLDRIDSADPAAAVLQLRLDLRAAGEIPALPEVSAVVATPGITAPAVVPSHPGRLFIDTQHGLGNRLRAMGSAAAIARATGREMVVVWAPDHHCQARLADLFTHDGPVIEECFPDRARAEGATVLNYMEIEPGATKGAALTLTEGRDAYVRSAYVINHPASDWTSENLFLHALRPAAEVQALTDAVPGPHAIGLHIRMEGAPGQPLGSYDSPENWTADGHAAIQEWRSKSHYNRFMARLDTLLAEDPQARAFLAADLPETYAAFADRYGSRVAALPRAEYDRSATQARHALADILLLSRTGHLLGSNWSSFTEAALRMSTTITRHERAGVEF